MLERVDETAAEAGGDPSVSPPVQRAARLLRHIAEGDRVTNMSRTARELGINRTTLLRLLHTLEVERFIEALPDGQGWRIGIGLIGLTAQAFFSEDLVQTAVPVLTRLTENLSLSSHLGALDGQPLHTRLALESIGAAKMDLTAMAFCCPDLVGARMVQHDDGDGHAHCAPRISESLGKVP